METSKFLLQELIQTKRDFFKLFEKLQNEYIINLKKYGKEDARCGFFGVSFELVLWLMINLDNFSDFCKKKKILDGYIQNTYDDYQQYLISYNTITRTSFLTRMMFNVEDFLKSTLTQLEQSPNQKYHGLCKNYLKCLNYYEEKRHKIMSLPAQIRNSNHNGGFTEYPIDIIIRGISFKADKGERIIFADWRRTYISLDTLFDLLIETIPLLEKLSFIPSTYSKLWKQDPLS